MFQVNELLDWIKNLRKKNLSGASVVMSWTGRRIQPLQKRSYFGFHYRAVEDPSQFSSERISKSEAMRRVRLVLDVVYGFPVLPKSFTMRNPPKEVCKTFLFEQVELKFSYL